VLVYSGASNTGAHVKDERQKLVVRETADTDGETVSSEQTGSYSVHFVISHVTVWEVTTLQQTEICILLLLLLHLQCIV